MLGGSIGSEKEWQTLQLKAVLHNMWMAASQQPYWTYPNLWNISLISSLYFSHFLSFQNNRLQCLLIWLSITTDSLHSTSISCPLPLILVPCVPVPDIGLHTVYINSVYNQIATVLCVVLYSRDVTQQQQRCQRTLNTAGLWAAAASSRSHRLSRHTQHTHTHTD